MVLLEIFARHTGPWAAKPSRLSCHVLLPRRPGCRLLIRRCRFRSCQAAFQPRSAVATFIYRLIFTFDRRLQALLLHMQRKQAEIWGFEWHEPGARDKALAFFHDYYAECRRRIPQERRIEFKVQDGWAPLCQHLGVEVPSVLVDGEEVTVPFPRTNEAAEFHKRVGRLRSSLLSAALWDLANRAVWFAAATYTLHRLLPLGDVARVTWPWTSRS